MMQGVKFARKLASTTPFSDLLVQDRITPAGTSDSDLTRWVLNENICVGIVLSRNSRLAFSWTKNAIGVRLILIA